MPHAKRNFFHYLPLYGCIATGIIYVTIGIIAILSFLKIRNGGADESSMLAMLNDFTWGKIIIWIILSGTISYIAWRVYEAVTDPYGYGKELTGKVKRAGIMLSTIADALIVSAAVRVLLGIGNIQVNGQPLEEREMIHTMLGKPWGSFIVITIGVIICVTAFIQFEYGITKGYKERVTEENFNVITKKIFHLLGWIGYCTRGIILGIVGFFFIKSGVLKNSTYIVNTDKAFDFIGDHVGHLYFILVATGTICYGLFMFALGITYKTKRVRA